MTAMEKQTAAAKEHEAAVLAVLDAVKELKSNGYQTARVILEDAVTGWERAGENLVRSIRTADPNG